MKIQYLILTFILMIIIVMSSFKNNCDYFRKISFLIEEKYNPTHKGLSSHNISNGISFHKIRMKMYKDKHPAFLTTQFDTLFLLEEYHLEDGSFTSSIWSIKNNIYYTYQLNKFYYPTNLFSKYMIGLVQKWDTTQIRQEEAHYSNTNPSSIIYSTRVIKISNGYKIDTFSFGNFIKLGRDNVAN